MFLNVFLPGGNVKLLKKRRTNDLPKMKLNHSATYSGFLMKLFAQSYNSNNTSINFHATANASILGTSQPASIAQKRLEAKKKKKCLKWIFDEQSWLWALKGNVSRNNIKS